jgi:hypothetical protein
MSLRLVKPVVTRLNAFSCRNVAIRSPRRPSTRSTLRSALLVPDEALRPPSIASPSRSKRGPATRGGTDADRIGNVAAVGGDMQVVD